VAQKKYRARNAKRVEPEQARHRGLLAGIAVAVIAVGAALIYSYRGLSPGGEGKNTALAAQYVGSSACGSCHGNEASAWRKSQHHDAMAQASEQSVLGNFNNAKFPYAGLTSTFFKREGKFFVNTDGPDGKLADYEVKYTFGVSPLQQYLIEFPDGRLQALSTRGLPMSMPSRCTRRGSQTRRSPGLKKLWRLIPAIVMFSKHWQAFTRHSAKSARPKNMGTSYERLAKMEA
jgi:hypothetical protein